MSAQKQPGSFGVIFPMSTLPMKAERSRNKERLEASLSGLCELELLKQRQECRVRSALCLGDSSVPCRPPWGALRLACYTLDTPKGKEANKYDLSLQTSHIKCSPLGTKESLEQQVAELKINSEVKSADTDLEDSRHISGEVLEAKQNECPEPKYHSVVPCSFSAPAGTGETGTGEAWLLERARRAMVTDVFGEIRGVEIQEEFQQLQKAETFIFELIQRRSLPTRPSKPRTSLAHDTRTISMVKQGHKEEQQSPKKEAVPVKSSLSQCLQGTASKAFNNLNPDHYLDIESPGEANPPYHHNIQQSGQDRPEFYQMPRQASMINPSHSTSLDYPSCGVVQVHPDSSNSELDSSQHFHSYPPPGLLKPYQPPLPEEQLVNAEYIPAQPCQASTRAYAHHHSNRHNAPGVPKSNQRTFSPERGHHTQEQQPTTSQVQPSRCRGGPKKCRSIEDRNGATRKLGKKACRSQSENSLPRFPERKYNTVERDGGEAGSGGRGSRSSQSKTRKQQQGSGNYRCWKSTLELSQDEADQPPTQAPMHGSLNSNPKDNFARRTRKSRSTHTSYVYPHRNYNQHPHSQHHQHMEYQLERHQVPICQPSDDYTHPRQGESESSMSEADSPDSSSLSTDSDESGGLVWPQQLPPQLSLPSPPAATGATLQPKAFVKIKASHALKKKIMRFRTGSLKVITTV
ncbi:Dapper 1-B [Channa argus]|uniref:Dapper 1-B n=1 Tax=Channa argus TaxID=215402 RepID=A0A6G1QVU7_CHAAH|nr:Dapper 1-B [Channa argus]